MGLVIDMKNEKKIYYYFIDILSKSFSKIAKNAVAVIFLMLHTKLFEHEPHISEKNMKNDSFRIKEVGAF